MLALAKFRGVIGESKVKETMNALGLDPSLTQKVRHYSLGMKQKLALTQATMEDPEVLILDESFNALAIDTVANVKTLLRDFHQGGAPSCSQATTPIDIPELATRLLTLDNGRLRTENENSAALKE